MTDEELTIDEPARKTGMTVRNIRAHQSRGLLPPPAVRARTGRYGPEHVARLELILEMQANGYNPSLLRAGDELVRLAIPIERGSEMVEQAGRTADGIGERFVKLPMESVSQDSGTEWAATSAALERLRPLVTQLLVAVSTSA